MCSASEWTLDGRVEDFRELLGENGQSTLHCVVFSALLRFGSKWSRIQRTTQTCVTKQEDVGRIWAGGLKSSVCALNQKSVSFASKRKP